MEGALLCACLADGDEVIKVVLQEFYAQVLSNPLEDICDCIEEVYTMEVEHRPNGEAASTFGGCSTAYSVHIHVPGEGQSSE